MSELIPAAVHQAWNWSSIPVETIAPRIERQMIHGDKLMVCRLRFAPGTVTQAHEHPHEQLTIVESGRARFVIGYPCTSHRSRIFELPSLRSPTPAP